MRPIQIFFSMSFHTKFKQSEKNYHLLEVITVFQYLTLHANELLFRFIPVFSSLFSSILTLLLPSLFFFFLSLREWTVLSMPYLIIHKLDPQIR